MDLVVFEFSYLAFHVSSYKNRFATSLICMLLQFKIKCFLQIYEVLHILDFDNVFFLFINVRFRPLL